jgi:TM2 domain-containing membrane protein YozV
MKHVTIIIAYLLLFCNVSVAQYSINKKKYDYRTYTYEVGDPYNTGVAGVTSLLLPGLGQMISGENGRGAAFLVGYIGCWGIFYAGGRLAGSTMENNTIANGMRYIIQPYKTALPLQGRYIST